MFVGDIVVSNARRFPSRDALVADGTRLRWSDLFTRTTRLANWLIDEAHLEVGDRVAVLADNRFEHVESSYATALAGLGHVPINSRLSAQEVQAAVADSGARVLLYGAPDMHHVEGRLDHSDMRLVALDGSGPGTNYADIVASGPPRCHPRRSSRTPSAGWCTRAGRRVRPRRSRSPTATSWPRRSTRR
jgi:long-subunit acyl-CoA synthetase (AMP-forming)